MVPSRALNVARFVAGMALVVAGCSRHPAPVAHVAAPPPGFEAAEQAWRTQRVQDLTRPDGWTSLVGLHWLDPGAHYIGSAHDNGIRLAVGPPQLGMIDVAHGRLRFVPNAAAHLTVDGKPAGSMSLRADDDPAGANVIAFDGGKGQATVIRRGDRYALRVRHADAATRLHFAGLQYWPGGADWIVDARFVANPKGTTLPVVNIIGIEEATPNPGVVEFMRGGRTYRLQALEGDDGGLFLVFADRTSGHGSYGAGRFIDTAPPDANGHVRIDFNQAYNPPCAFTSFATCPLPPASNRLDLAITAGEKSYAGTH